MITLLPPLHHRSSPLGTIAIEPVTEEFRRLSGSIEEISEYLQLAQQRRPLRDQLDEAGELMDGE